MSARNLPAPMLPRRGQPAPIFRMAAATVRGFATNTSVEKAGRELYGRGGLETRAAAAPARLDTPARAGTFGHDMVADLLQEATTLSAGANLMTRGLRVSLDNIASLRIARLRRRRKHRPG
jgi:hypothetical protein